MATLSTVVFTLFAGLSLVDTVYFTTAIVTTIGFGDINLREAPTPLKLYGVVFMLLGAALLAVSYAFITDLLVGARLARQSGAVSRRMRDHIVVCGLGTIGYRVVEQLARMRVPVVAVELREDGPFVQSARSLRVPILFASARQPETLEASRLGQARCLVIATDDDVANLETALNASTLNPGLRIVLRLFHPDFAARVERTFDIHISRSPSALAAPAFAAAAEGKRVFGTVPIRRGGADLRADACGAGHHSGGRDHSLPGGYNGGTGAPACGRRPGVLAAIQGDGARRGPRAGGGGDAQGPDPVPGADRRGDGRRRARHVVADCPRLRPSAGF